MKKNAEMDYMLAGGKKRKKKSQQHWTTVSGLAIVYTCIYSMFEGLRSAATSLGSLPRLPV